MSVDDIARAVAESALSVEERLGFLDLCEARSVEELLADRDRVSSRLRTIEKGVEDGSLARGELAGPIARSLIDLLDEAAERSFVERRVLAGAVEYFLRTDDTEGDYTSNHGFEDDARVVIAVSDALGRNDISTNLTIILP